MSLCEREALYPGNKSGRIVNELENVGEKCELDDIPKVENPEKPSNCGSVSECVEDPEALGEVESPEVEIPFSDDRDL